MYTNLTQLSLQFDFLKFKINHTSAYKSLILIIHHSKSIKLQLSSSARLSRWLIHHYYIFISNIIFALYFLSRKCQFCIKKWKIRLKTIFSFCSSWSRHNLIIALKFAWIVVCIRKCLNCDTNKAFFIAHLTSKLICDECEK